MEIERKGHDDLTDLRGMNMAPDPNNRYRLVAESALVTMANCKTSHTTARVLAAAYLELTPALRTVGLANTGVN